MNNTIEILAPGGSYKSLKAAIDSGADAVYFGGARFGARANAANLSNDEIEEAVKYAHLRSAKLYVTVNTLVSDSEIEEAFEFLKFCYTTGVDGVIVQDTGIVNMIKTYFPHFRIHASTQMTVHNLSGVLQAEKMGFDRVVLSRELSFREIKYIAENSNVELEVFVHGALCMCYSGQCLFSSFLGGRSGNRGQCAQPCRLAYTLTDSDETPISEKDKYLLSLKDLCLVEHMESLKNVGVASLKIEGRMKSDAYVSAVCGIYNKYRNGGQVSKKDKILLENVFSRQGFTQGYYNGTTGREMLSYSSNHDNIYSTVTEDVTSEAMEYSQSDFEIPISASFCARLGKKPVFECTYNNKTYTAFGESEIGEASNVPATAERVTEQLSKLGGTVFSLEKLTVDIDENIYIPIKDINSVRRDVISQIEADLIGTPPEYEGRKFSVILPNKKETVPIQTASVLTKEQAMAAYDIGFERIYIPFVLYLSDPNFYNQDTDIYVVTLPPISHKMEYGDYSRIKTDRVCATNIGHLAHRDEFEDIHADYRLNTFNSLGIKELMKWGVKSVTLSPELTLSQIKSIGKSIDTEVVVYGRISLMTVKNCVIKSALGQCGCKNEEIYYLRDRKNISFPVVPNKENCTNVIYNSAPIIMSDRMGEVLQCGASLHRFDFTTESPEEMYSIMKMYESGIKPKGFFTRGHYYNPVN